MANLVSVLAYNQFILENTEINTEFYTGLFYTYYYDYRRDIINFYKIPKKVRDFYDGRPLVFIFEKYVTKDNKPMVRGINLHYMPLIERELWLNLLTKVGAEYIKNNDRILLPKEIITRLTAKSKYAIKQYDINKISKVRKVPYNKIGTLAAFIPPTHEGKSYLDIVADYNLYKPGQ